MLKALRQFIAEISGEERAGAQPVLDQRLAAAALLHHVIAVDGTIEAVERSRLLELLKAEFELDDAGAEALFGQAETAEGQYRREAAQRISALERERVFAYRRLNLMRAVADAVAGSETEEVAVASAQAILRSKLGWSSDSEARKRVTRRR